MGRLNPVMTPSPGERRRLFVGDRISFTAGDAQGRPPEKGWKALLRTNLGRAAQLRSEVLQAHTRSLPLAGASWRDVPMIEQAGGWSLELPLIETGFFKAKAYLLDDRGWQLWPAGPDVGISVHPNCYRTGNILYCAFPRLFGSSKTARQSSEDKFASLVKPLDETGYAVIPPSGKLRDLVRELPHIFDVLNCRILHLLPVNPTPATYARFGRFGSPYAALDLTAIDSALVVFDRRSTGVDQFRELTYAVHLRGGRVFLDIVINHTGWGSVLQENHPEWFLRHGDGTFASPGAWGTTWEDLVELSHENVALWDKLADVFITWCRRGVDGFRCDAGYMVPVAAWQYIVARVQQVYPDTIFFLEGLGGAWEATEALLTEGGMQWAYSELFQNYSGAQVASYLDHSLPQSDRVGLLVHYSETHDNDRLAARGRRWSLLRNRLCALTSDDGGFGFTCGVEWLAAEKIRVHGSTGLCWGSKENLVPELSTLNRLLLEHPCFFSGARLSRLSAADSPVYALWRESEEGLDAVLVLVNTDVENEHKLVLSATGRAQFADLSSWVDLLGQATTEIGRSDTNLQIRMPAGAAFCLAARPQIRGLHGEAYRRAKAQAAWALTALGQSLPAESIGPVDWRKLAAEVENSPAGFLAKVARLTAEDAGADLSARLAQMSGDSSYARVVGWDRSDCRRVAMVPPRHWLLLTDTAPFRASLSFSDGSLPQNIQSIPAGDRHVGCFPPRESSAEAELLLERYTAEQSHLRAAIRFLSGEPLNTPTPARNADLVLLTNGRGAMARISIDLGQVRSKYDCVLGANLHPTLPVDRHVLAKRLRAWITADGFISPLDFRCVDSFEIGPPAVWNFVANAGDGRTVQIQMTAEMFPNRNTVRFRFSRPSAARAAGKQLPATADVRLTVRLDIEDRNFHWETHRNSGAEHHFHTHVHPLPASAIQRPKDKPEVSGSSTESLLGFAFTPAADRQLRVFADSGRYHPQPEWSENLPHPVEQSRAQVGAGDAFSPGWFELPLPAGAAVSVVVTAEIPRPGELLRVEQDAAAHTEKASAPADSAVVPGSASPAADPFSTRLLQAIRAFVVQRDSGKTVIAGYPWFLDWGRDTFICARGLLAAGMIEEVRQIVLTFARFEKDGTLPNTIFGTDASNRDTSDAPLWFGLVCEELALIKAKDESLYHTKVDELSGRTLLVVLESIASNYIKGTPNGICMDSDSALIWSPSHFTWMDTNYPAGTPREGYPVEIQALWIRLLRQLARVSDSTLRSRWSELADQAQASLERLFWRDDLGFYADALLARPGQRASEAAADDALRSNGLFVVGLGLAEKSRARRCVQAAIRYLVVPGALRTLAPLPVRVPLVIRSQDGRPLNDPSNPYWGRYEGDEDTRRKPAYHNGTAWTWTFPTLCEALVRAWDFSPESVAAAKAYLGSMEQLMNEGCLGHLPEILDGDAPHTQRGCDAQAWSATEALRVWKLLPSRE